MSVAHAGSAAAEATFTIVNERGLHARAAAQLVRLASSFASEVDLEKDGQTANAKSIMGLLLLCGGPGARVTVRARGPDAAAAVEAIGRLIASRFGEPR